MTDTRLDRILCGGTAAARGAFTPDPPTGVLVVFLETDTGDAYYWNTGTAAWVAWPGGSAVLADGDYGDISVSSTGTVFTVDADAISDAKLRNSTALTVIGRSANSTGDPADIAAANDGEVLRRSGTSLGFGTLATAGLADDAVTYAKLQNVSAASKLLGRGSAGGSGDTEEITLGSGLSMSGTTLSITGGYVSGIVNDPRQWLGSAGHEFWIIPGNADLFNPSSATNLAGLDSYGWTTTSLVFAGSGTGDFMSSSDEDAQRVGGDAAGDTLASPQIFGSYSHMEQASKLLGYTPTKLVAEFRAQMFVSSANETGTFIGFAVAGVTDITAAGGVAAIVSDGTNYRLRSDNGNDAGAAIDTSIHTFKIEVTAATTEWFIDGVSQGTITTEADVWPCTFIVRSGTTNRLVLMWARVYYSA